MNIYFCESINESISILDDKESTHCVRVMRQKLGDEIILMDGNGKFAKGIIISDSKKRVEVQVNSIEYFERKKNSLHIAIAPTKSNDRIEWFLEKATEFDIAEVTFLITENSERRKINLERFQKIVLSAAKQSKSAYLPKLNQICSFSKFIESLEHQQQKFIATLVAQKDNQFHHLFQKEGQSTVLIGSEGGFSKAEVSQAMENGLQPILLGNKRLRTETAGVYVSAIHYFKNK